MKNETFYIVVVDDDAILGKSLASILEKEGYKASVFPNAEEALAFAQQNKFDVMISDLIMPGKTGLDLLGAIKVIRPGVEVILQTGHGTIERAVEAIKKGAYDFLTKPTSKSDLLKVVGKALEKSKLARENRELRDKLDHYEKFNRVIGRGAAMQKILNLAEQVAPTGATVLITGESGTGKEVIANLIHRLSPRKDKAFVKVNCSALTETLLESELFGHEKGSFTGAIDRRFGRFEVADGGTLFLDEIGDISPALQVKLLRFLQEREFERVGSSITLKSDVRIIAATNARLEEKIRGGKFREDLYYRLRVIEMNLPPLRERGDDIPLFAAHFLKMFCERNGKTLHGISPETMKLFQSYSWPGNVREFENCLERAVILTADGEYVRPDVLPASLVDSSMLDETKQKDGKNHLGYMMIPFGLSIDKVEALVFEKTLQHHAGDKLKAARELGVSQRTLYRKLEKES